MQTANHSFSEYLNQGPARYSNNSQGHKQTVILHNNLISWDSIYDADRLVFIFHYGFNLCMLFTLR